MTSSTTTRTGRLAGASGALVPALGVAGLVTIVVGTFLPWLRSGRVLRNSYETDGAIRRLLVTDGIAHGALAIWPAVSLACAAIIALYTLGARGVGLALAVVTALVAAAVGIGALTAPRLGSLAVETSGPAVTLAGSILVLLAATLRFLIFVRDDRRTR
jgi:hypothetical protein